MNLEIKKEVKIIYSKLKNAGFEVYLVGGCVRNLIIGKTVLDWDLTTNATPDKIQEIFPDSFYDNSFGTVGVPFDNQKDDEEKQYAEVTTYRIEKGYRNHRHPDSIEWGTSLKEDLARRDFTVNAIAIEIDKDQVKIIDLVNGSLDIKNKLIKAVGNPDERFEEDALRLLRAVRFATVLDFEIEENTLIAIKKHYQLISHVSQERIRDELLKILDSDNPYKGIMLMDEFKMLDLVFPELSRGKGISQQRPGRHHVNDVFTHNVLSLKHCPSKDPIVRLATLLHDSGKPYVAAKDKEGFVIFYNHEVVGARIAKDISDRLRLSKKQKNRIFTLIRWHMFTVDEHITDSAIRRFIRRVGVENVKDIIDLRIGDRLGGGTQVAESWRLKRFKERLEQQLHPPFSINDLAVDGNDIMKKLTLEPGPEVGKLLKSLFEEVDEDLSKNTKDYLMKRIDDIGNTSK